MKIQFASAQEALRNKSTHFKCNNLKRWKIEVGDLFAIRFHVWVEGDPQEYQHSHPWNFLTFVLWGGYDDVGEGRETDRVRAPSIRYRPLTWRHSVINVRPGTLSLVLTGKVVNDWRFWIKDREVDVDEWNNRECGE